MTAERRRKPRPAPGRSSRAPTDRKGQARKNTGRSGGHNGGRRPTNLWQVIAEVDGKPVTMIDRACEVIRGGGFAKDAAARLGVRVETYRVWLTLGAQTTRAILAGQTVEAALSDHERQCVELEYRTWQAEYEGRADKLAALDRLMLGGFERIRVVERHTIDPTKEGDAGVTVERTEHREVAMPDAGAIRWWLQVRYPDEFRQQVAVTGPEGGPVVDLARPVEQLRSLLGRFAESSQRAAELPLPDAVRNGNGHDTEQETPR